MNFNKTLKGNYLLTLHHHFKASLLQAWKQASDFSGYAAIVGLQWVDCGGWVAVGALLSVEYGGWVMVGGL